MLGVQHIVYLMLENRSLDNVLGWLYDDTTKPQHFIPSSSASTPYDGLKPNTYSNKSNDGRPVYASQILSSEGQYIPDVDPGEEYQHVQQQIANNMGGFLTDYQATAPESKNPDCIMQSYTPQSLPILNTLASQFAVSDAYFSSVPSNTDANRAFALTGNSIGTYDRQQETAMVDTAVYHAMGIPPYPFSRRSLWDVLWESGLKLPTDWSIFYHQTWPGPNVPIVGPGNQCFTQLMLDSLQNPAYGSAFFRGIDQFYRILNNAPNTQLPTFSYLEPCWNIFYDGTNYQNGNDYHPPGNLACGEAFLELLFTKLQASKYWPDTLLIITFDEHGGTYDHVEPPTGVKAPWADPKKDGTAPPQHSVVPFDFTGLGVRVPLLLISPLIEAGTVIRSDTAVPFDHTSILATIFRLLGIDSDTWQLGSRTANAPTFESVLTRQGKPLRAHVTLPGAQNCNPSVELMDAELSSLPGSIMARGLAQKAREHNVPDSELRELFKEHLVDVRTTSQLNEQAGRVTDRIQSRT
jgi:Phosphoesterase family